MPPPRRTSPLITFAIVLTVLAVVGFLFIRSLDDARAEPFLVRPSHLQGWTLVAADGAQGETARLALAPPAEMPMRLFRQTFTRAGESLSTPLQPGIALVLGDELRGVTVPAEELMTMARAAGVDRAPIRPACMGYRRDSQPGVTRQVYFVVFDLPEFAVFRQALAARLGTMGVEGFAPDGLSPIMLLAGQPDVSRWMPIVVDRATDCMAPIAEEPE
jgi:hypothetical protein